MNIRLFNNTLRLINRCFPNGKAITESQFLYFLLGYTYADTETEHDKYLLNLEDALGNCLTGKDTLRNTLGDRYLNILSKSQTLTLANLVKIALDKDPKTSRNTKMLLLNMNKELANLCTKHSLPYTDSENAEKLLSSLFTACITEKKFPRLFASQKKQQLKPATIKETLGRSDDSISLLQCLNQHHKVIISGQSGSGKSRFMQYCLSTWNLSDYCYVSYASDLESTKKDFLFYEDKGLTSKTSLEDLMDKTFESSLLVIDHMNVSENLVAELDELASYAINIIIITIADFPSDAFHTFSLSTLTDDTLQNIFENSSGTSLEDEDRDLLFQVSQRNVLLISLIAGQYKQIAKQSAEHTKILHQLFSNLSDTLNVHLSNVDKYTYTFKHPYDKKALDLLGHIKSIYANFATKHKESDPLRRTMRFLCCFGYSTIPLSFLKMFSEYDQKALEALSEMGWILITDSTVQLPSLIARSAFAYEIPSVADCYDQIDKMTDFLRNYDQTLTIPYLSNTLFTFACSINAKVKVKNNPNQKHASTEFENWQDLLYSLYIYYKENGDFLLAEKVIRLIYYPNIAHKHSELDSNFFQFSIHMSLQDWIKKIPEETDKLIAMIDCETLIHSTIAPLLITSMDIIIYLYCSCVSSSYNNQLSATERKEIEDYHHKLINALGITLHYIPPPRLNRKPKLSDAQYEYYQLCYALMISGKRFFSSLLDPHIPENSAITSDTDSPVSRLLNETNANYRIRGIAFTMFIRSLYRNDLEGKLHTSEYPIDSEMLILAIRCDIAKLHEQIIACEQIPWHTTWISLFCYLQLLEELSKLYSKNNQYISTAYYPYILKTLLCRSAFSKKEREEFYDRIISRFPYEI